MLRITAGKFKGRPIKTVANFKTRYTTSLVRKAIFDMVNVDGKVFADVFAGSGIMGFEALSRGARKVIFLDVSERSIRTIRYNALELGVEESCIIVRGDFRRKLPMMEEVDVLFADPPFEHNMVWEILKILDANEIFRDCAVIEVSKHEKYDLTLNNLLIEKRGYGDIEILICRKSSFHTI